MKKTTVSVLLVATACSVFPAMGCKKSDVQSNEITGITEEKAEDKPTISFLGDEIGSAFVVPKTAVVIGEENGMVEYSVDLRNEFFVGTVFYSIYDSKLEGVNLLFESPSTDEMIKAYSTKLKSSPGRNKDGAIEWVGKNGVVQIRPGSVMLYSDKFHHHIERKFNKQRQDRAKAL